MKRNLLSALLAALLVGGCASTPMVWVDRSGSGRDSSQLNLAVAQCRADTDSFQEQVTPMLTESCLKLPYQAQPTCDAVVLGTIAHDVREHMQQCMVAAGWSLSPAITRPPADGTPAPIPEPASPEPADATKTERQWSQVFQGVDSAGNGVTGYIDEASVSREGSVVHFTGMLSFVSPQRIPHAFLTHSYESAEMALSIDCSKMQYSITHEKDYTEQQLGGEAVNSRHIFFNSDKVIPTTGFFSEARGNLCG